MKNALHTASLVLLLFLTSSAGSFAQDTAAGSYNKGLTKYSKGDLDGAIADFSRTIEIDPKYKKVYYKRGLAKYYNKGS